ncbi:PREDICTED: tripartite motif-containing protein 7-like [Gekko japonicus]|uniref:RING-type E3 ubiquitin transferase n=1 Tax=Gekko japonicus TaxID=146911 RepID=A0ABM1JMJ6_GEKJA|nr:PREDICTED: tripartite motif-containing protein 7-like [Gekko japonicus]
MASAPPSIDVEEVVTCPICLGCLTEPVVLDCGHSFCQGCITNYCEKWEALGGLECPTCKFKIRKGNFRRNWQLAHLLEKMKQLPLSSGGKDRCLKHKEKLHLFCKEDEQLVCFFCERSPEHRGHKILLLEEAAQQYKDQIHRCLETVKNERQKILAYKADAEKESQDLLKQNELERENTVALFRQLHEFLADQEKLLLFQLEELEKDIARARDECLARLSKELSSLERLIQEMEEKHQRADIDVLKDVRSTLQRYQKKETFANPGAFPPGLKWRLWSCWEINHLLESVTKKFQTNMTLDPIAAYTELILSEDRRSITCQTKAQDLPEHPEDVYSYSCVLGSEGFTSGCHFWEVTVGSEEGWAVGVARNSVRRKEKFSFSPEQGIWAMGWNKGRYKAFIMGNNPPLTPCGELKRIRVSLNYEGGQVAFFDADRAALLYRFSEGSFSGETLNPFFAVYGKGYLRVCR